MPDYEKLSREEVFSRVAEAENDLHVLRKLQGFSIATDKITTVKGPGNYHLVILDSSTRSVSIRPFPKTQLEQANIEYAKIEERAQNGEPIEAVLVSAGPIEALKKAYPNYFLDTHAFVTQIERVIADVTSVSAKKRSSAR